LEDEAGSLATNPLRCQNQTSPYIRKLFGGRVPGMPHARPQGLVITVDGPAASGKGTIASRLGSAYGLPVLDTGLLYRAVGVRLAQSGGDISDEAAAAAVARGLTASDLDDPAFRTRAAGEAASRVAVHPAVRAALLELQQGFARQPGGAVLDGRDMGTVIAPWAPAKLYVTAAPEIRAERRRRQLESQGEAAPFADVLADIRRRDARDGERAAAPMRPAEDAVLLDTSEMTIDGAADAARRIVEAARARLGSP
jgi:cytidylate kinase